MRAYPDTSFLCAIYNAQVHSSDADAYREAMEEPLHVAPALVFPPLVPALITGTTLAFARAVGEYGSVVFISGNLAGKTEILPLLIINKLEQHDIAGANALAALMLVVSFALLLVINLLQRWTSRRHAK